MIFRRFFIYINFSIFIALIVSGFFLLQYNLSIENITKTDDEIIKEYIKKDPILKILIKKRITENYIFLFSDEISSNTDTIMLVNYNTKTFKANILSIPRDTKVPIENQVIQKINSLYNKNQDKDHLLNTLSNMFGVEVKYYCYINLKTFREIIDLLGGIDYYIPVDIDYDDPYQDLHIHFKKGLQHLNGEEAEKFLRFRKPNNSEYTNELLEYYDGSDINRIQIQQDFLREFIDQKLKLTYISKIDDIIKTIYNNLETNIPLFNILDILLNITEFKSENLDIYMLPGIVEYDKIEKIDYFIYNNEQLDEIIISSFSIKEIEVMEETNE